MNMTDCPKFERCNAPICPLDDDWKIRGHGKGEPVCFYLREYVKQGGKARIQGYIPKEMFQRIGQVLPEIISQHGDIKRRLFRAKNSGSKIDALTKPGRAAA